MKNSRRTAAFIVARWLVTKEFPSDMLPKDESRSFVQDLVYTTIRRLRPLRSTLGVLMSKWPKGELEALLYVGAAQILYMPDVPDFAAVNETVNAAKECENPSIAKVTNGVLRNLIRRRDELEARISSAPLAERESFPSELIHRWIDRFGESDAERLAKWHNEPAETYIARKDGTYSALARGCRVEEVEGFSTGDFIIQDPGAAHAVALVDAQPGDDIFDACAAPGGKTVQLAWRGAKVTACEVNPKRRRQLEANIARLQLGSQVKVISEFPPLPRTFSKVLVDAPCSNTGVLRRRPDARWNWTVARMKELTHLQSEILDSASARVAPGGMLVYSTCSNEPEENEQQVEAFIARHPNFTLVSTTQSIPFETGYDGSFAAALITP